MRLSVIIVNYNVKAYLEQCLLTVMRAMEGIDGEVVVVDNLSSDGSVEMVRQKFPEVKLIANKVNAGFSRANNQAIDISTSEYVVLLNPDTVVGEDVFHKVLQFLDDTPDAGGLGVKMIDGRGRFLPESKRGLPTPLVAFYKIIGLARLFPYSRHFGRYHLGHLPNDKTASIEIISGACMFLRMSTLEKVGTLDESFFMYGEDIDLSYRILLGGYKNYYFPDAEIIHYKGESTKKSSINYVFVFYNAMAIFARKHFTKKRADLFATLINGSIFLSAAAAIIARFLYRIVLPISDALTGAFLFLVAHHLGWLGTSKEHVVITTILMIWSVASLMGIYDKPVKLMKCVMGTLTGTILSLVVATLLPLGGLATPVVLTLGSIVLASLLISRSILHILRVTGYDIRSSNARRVLVIGSKEEAEHAAALLWQTHYGLGEVRIIQPNGDPSLHDTLRNAIKLRKVDDVIFCAGDLAAQNIIQLIEDLGHTRVQFKIAHLNAGSIIGPNSIETIQDLYILDRYSVNSAEGRRSKRIMDLFISALLIISSPVSILFIKDKSNFLRNLREIILGNRTWVGYTRKYQRSLQLPKLGDSVLRPFSGNGSMGTENAKRRVDLAYAKDYRPLNDLHTVLKRLHRLGDGG